MKSAFQKPNLVLQRLAAGRAEEWNFRFLDNQISANDARLCHFLFRGFWQRGHLRGLDLRGNHSWPQHLHLSVFSFIPATIYDIS
jgi:hypothetical protein